MAAPKRRRLDAELVRRKIAPSRERAQGLIAERRVLVNGVVAAKAATQVEPEASIAVHDSDEPDWASRGAHKLLGALELLETAGITPRGLRCLDAGASTGGFTDVLLSRGADRVEAVDVGYGQLLWRLRSDPRVGVHDRTNVRTLTPEDIGGPVDLVVSDLSFISLRLVLPALAGCVRPGGDLALMVKPQFEVGKDRLGAGGVVRDPHLRAEAVAGVAAAAEASGLQTRGCVASPLPGPSGNVEYFLWLRRPDTSPDPPVDPASGPAGDPAATRALIEAAVAAGPR